LGGTSHTLSFDYDGQLTQITQGQNTTDFAYDALGRRFSRTAGGTTTQFVSAGSAIVAEKQGGTYTAAYTFGDDLLRKDGEYPMYDGHGTERTICNSSQTVTGTANYEGFGQTLGTTGSSSNPYMYAGNWGYRTDGDAGLMHVGARYYDPQVGRFITRDSMLGQHPYLYCEHEPVGFVDPSGNDPTPWQKFWRTVRIAIMWSREPDPIVVKNPPTRPPIVRIVPRPGGPKPPIGGGGGSGGGPGGVITIGIGVGVGADAAHRAIHWRRAIESYLDRDGNWSESGGF
jgi:RHS repeat-associated protein